MVCPANRQGKRGKHIVHALITVACTIFIILLGFIYTICGENSRYWYVVLPASLLKRERIDFAIARRCDSNLRHDLRIEIFYDYGLHCGIVAATASICSIYGKLLVASDEKQKSVLSAKRIERRSGNRRFRRHDVLDILFSGSFFVLCCIYGLLVSCLSPLYLF